MATYKKLLKNRAGDTIIPVTDVDAYSTTEQKVGVWIDGKTIYRKVVQGTLSGSSFNALATITNIDKLVKICGSYLRPDGVQTDCPRQTIQIYIGTDKVLYVRDSEGLNGTAKMAVYYTKTS